MRDVLVVGVGPDGVGSLLRLLAALLPSPCPVVVAVQGADARAVDALVRETSAVPAWDRQPIGSATVHLAPAGYHLLLEPHGLALSSDPPEHGARPALTPLFESAAWVYRDRALGVLLGSVGPDGEAAAAALPGAVRLGAGDTTFHHLLREVGVDRDH